jgi:hypothetical protein
MEPETLEFRLRECASIRRQIFCRRSEQENLPDKIADLLEDAADRIQDLEYQAATIRSVLNITN